LLYWLKERSFIEKEIIRIVLNQVFLNNALKDWIYALGAVVLSFIILRIITQLIHQRILKLSKKTKTDIDDLIAGLLKKINGLVLLILSLYVGSLFLTLPDKVKILLGKLIIVSLLLQAAIWGNGIIQYWVDRYRKQRMQEDAASVTSFSALGFVLQIVLWSLIVLLALDNLGIDITALVAGLGVGGIAVALAMQNILGDLFASLSIVMDKPFVIGDFIVVDTLMGSVEHIGLKTTRLRSLSGEQLIISNSDLLKSRIRNFKRMFERRVVFSLGVTYQTPLGKLQKIPVIIKSIIELQENIRFDRAHFKDYGDFSLNYEIVYWVKSPDYNVYMDIQQAINLEIFKQFQEQGIEFAYPTQTLFLNQEKGMDDTVSPE
jgi:small-conductance mechanosensitive channel